MSRRAAAIASLLALLAAVVVWQAPRLGAPKAGDSSPIDREAATPPAPLPPPGLARAPAPRAGGGEVGPGPGPLPKDVEPPPPKPPPPSIPIRVYTVDATTGASVASTWTLRFGGAGFFGPPLDDTEIEQLLNPAEPVPSGKELPLAIDESSDRPWELVVDPPEGYLAREKQTISRAPVAGARAVYARIPVHRAVDLTVSVDGPDGRPADGARIVALEVAGRAVRIDAVTLAAGVLRLRGLPYLPGEPVAAAIDWGTAAGDDAVPVPSEGIPDPELRTTVPEDLGAPWTVAVHLKGPTARTLDHLEIDNDFPAVFSSLQTSQGAGGDLRIRVLGCDGKPVPDAAVYGARTDADGVAVVEHVSLGEHELAVSVPSRLPARATAFVREGQETEVVLREPAGARLDVIVTDEAGRPRPSAHLSLGNRLVFDVVDGVQRIDMFTDPFGRRSFARVEPGEATVTATWGTRCGSEKVLLRDGERATVRIVAR